MRRSLRRSFLKGYGVTNFFAPPKLSGAYSLGS